MSSLPYLSAWLLSFPSSIISDWAIRTKKISTRTSRMVCNSIGFAVPAVALVCLSFVEDNALLAVAILIVAVAANILAYCGFQVNHMDLSPNYAGPLMGFTNTAATMCSILAPIIHSYVVSDLVSCWEHFFFFFNVSFYKI